ncbi:MAG TPA: anhydro-N-acetylmuramic acid kinase [Terriglobia bacterium]|nr:anhydro-N-acetylmuramic acid kinase [Terriglobia bacterium]
MAERLAVGLISGTSLDGVDAALVRIGGSLERPRLRLLAFTTVPYPPPVRLRLLRAAGGEAVTSGEVSDLNFLLGELFAAAALRVCRQGRVAPKRLSVIGSHGQTIFHQGRPQPFGGRNEGPFVGGGGETSRRQLASTLQIAEPAIIAAKTGVPVVADFRTADMAAGGEGAPLIPLVDYLVLGDAGRNTIALNIGGIANLTVIPAGGQVEEVFGFDTGPGNMVMDGLVRHFTRGRRSYDVDGRLAAQGKVIERLFGDLLRLAFFDRQPPKSAGREQFGGPFLERHFLSRRGAAFKDLLRTANELTARSIAEALQRFVFPRLAIQPGRDRLVVSGGGAHNRLLLARLAEFLPQLDVRLSDEYGLPADAKEAIAFAVLADRTMHGLPGNLPAVTGARRPVVLGKVCQPVVGRR